MSFKKKVLIKIILFYFLPFSFSFGQNLAEIFKELTCVKDVKLYYPHFLKGKLSLDRQDRFFNCVWGFLDAVVNKKIVIHTPNRDHFTKNEIFKMFHILFKYEEERSKQLTEKLLLFKKVLIGGSIDKIKDEELSKLLNLVFDYKEAYYIIHKEIPILTKLFKGERINSERPKKTLEQLRKTSLLLSRAYERENVSYTIEDLSKYPKYFKKENLKWHAFFSISQNVFEGVLFPQKEIKGENWSVFVNVIRRSFDLLFYHNEYLLKELTEIQLAYNLSSAIERVFPILASNESLFLERGFPLKNFDNILQSSLEFINLPEEKSGFLSHFKNEKRLRFLTRVFFTLSLDKNNLNSPDKKEAGADWEAESSVVNFSFPDSRFYFSENHFTEEKLKTDYFISSEKIKKIKEWIKDYKSGILNIYRGFEEGTAREKGMKHWLDLFFGWDEQKQMIYGSFKPTDNHSKMIHLLSYQAFLSLLLTHYVPESYFDSEEKELSKDDWSVIVSNLAPFFAVSFGVEGFQNSWKNSLEELFNIADLFLNSSDANQKLNRKELLDLSIHLISALKQSQKASSNLLNLCSTQNFSNCAVDSLLDSSEMLKPYPRFKDFIFPSNRIKYRQNIQIILSGLEKGDSRLQLLELFLLIQVMEVNYYQRINTNLYFNLESEELLVFADSLKESIFLSVPFLYNSDQALAFLLYSFQSKEIPFFTGAEFEPVRFTHWYLNPKVRSSFSITPNDFHHLGFKFYNLYKRF